MNMGITKIDWAHVVINPITGCLFACPYCYGQGLANRFKQGDYKPAFHPERIDEFKAARVHGKRVFIDSVSDTFGPWIPAGWILDVLAMARSKDDGSNVFLFLTKNPRRYAEFAFRPSEWVGTTLDAGYDTSPAPPPNTERLDALLACEHPNRFLSVEPFLPEVEVLDGYREMFSRIDRSRIKWIIVGLKTPVRVKNPAIKDAWALGVRRFMSDLRGLFPGVPVFCKGSIHKVMNSMEVPQEFPAGFPTTKKRTPKTNKVA